MEFVYVVPDFDGEIYIGFTDRDFAILANAMGGGKYIKVPIVKDVESFVRDQALEELLIDFRRVKGLELNIKGPYLAITRSGDDKHAFITEDVDVVGLMFFLKDESDIDISIYVLPIIDDFDNFDDLKMGRFGEVSYEMKNVKV